jgi:hypothetical protein
LLQKKKVGVIYLNLIVEIYFFEKVEIYLVVVNGSKDISLSTTTFSVPKSMRVFCYNFTLHVSEGDEIEYELRRDSGFLDLGECQ